MVRKNKKAFTLVEVLTVIVILGILSTIGIVTVVNIRKNQEKKFDQTQYHLFVETAKTYFSDNKSKLPTLSETTSVVYLIDLINENYIDSLLDYHKKSYQVDKSYVTVTKVGSEYAYTATLYPQGKKADILVKPEDENKCNIEFSNYRKDDDIKMNSIKNSIETVHYTNQTPKVDITIKDLDGIKAFQYIIYKNKKKVHTGTVINPHKTEASDTITLDINDYEDGTYQIEVIVYDNADCVTSDKSEKIMIDRVAPSCTTIKVPDKEWTNQNTKVTGSCTDNKGKTEGNSGCVQNSVSISEITTSVSESYSPGTVEDNAGNRTKCDSINVNIDKEKPTVTLSATSQNRNYNTTTANVTVNIKDNNATKYELSTSNFPTKTYEQMTVSGVNGDNITSMNVHSSYDGTSKTIYVTVKDIAGNEATEKTTYTIYKNCTKTVANGNPTYGACSANCGSGTRLQTQAMKDTYLGTACSSVRTTVSCGTLPDCCSSVTYEDGDDCTVECGGGTYNRLAYSYYTGDRCPNKDLSNGGAACNTESCCSDATWGSWSSYKPTKNSKGVITACKKTRKKKTSDGTVCGTQTKSYNLGKCIGKNKCNIRGNTKYKVDVHWPFNPSSVTMTCGSSHSKGYWHYCTDSNSNLYNRLGKVGSANTFQWVCPDVARGKGPNGASYYVIDDSGGKWSKYSKACYATSSGCN